VEKQVAILYAATKGAVDDIPTARVKEFEAGYYRFLEAERPELLATLGETKTLDDETAKGLDDAVAAYRASFLA
jgi:F-type H+-transporting ATPase subunit alpha